MHGQSQLASRNPEYFLPGAPLEITNSIDSLSPKSPILPVLLEAHPAPWVRHHNIIGQAPRDGFKNKASMWFSGEGDGVVSLASARVDEAASEIVVPADHMNVHRHPQSILEVRRILKLHIAELQAFARDGAVEYAASAEAGDLIPLPPPVATAPTLELTR
jgi:hypothetical protein